jgi:outer membrane lipoprotein SlyB
MMNKKIQKKCCSGFLIMLSLAMVGCSSVPGSYGQSGNTYSKNQMRSMQTVLMGEVISVEEVAIEGDQNGLLTIAGAGVGGVLGSKIGGGKGSMIATIAGSVLGGLATDVAQKMMSSKKGLAMMVRLERGDTVQIVQDADISFSPGQKVKVLSGGGADRVVPL